MARLHLLLTAILFILIIVSCSHKTHPSHTIPADEKNITANNADSALAKKPIKKKEKVVIPKVISVNDSAAHKSVDGRLYYDVLGHRYWRNYKDGKYYLFNKSMYTNDAFKPK